MSRITLGRLPLALVLGAQDIRQIYRRSVVGPFWITAGMALQIASIGIVFSLIFKTDVQNYLPYLATSIILWGFISGNLNEACSSFIASESIIKQIDIPLYVFVARTLWKNLLVLGHHLLILPIVFLFLSKGLGWGVVLIIPGILILLLNLSWITFILASVSARYRDFPPIISSLLGIAFYVTPVMWTPELLGDEKLQHIILGFNPLYHFLQIVRLPILGEFPTIENWSISLLVAGLGWISAFGVHKRFARMIAYWV